MSTVYEMDDPAVMSPARARALFRSGAVLPTSGWCHGHTQANLIVVPRDWAYDMLLFTQRNPKPCPVLDVTEPGSPRTVLGRSVDLRTDLPSYRVWEHGELVAEPSDVADRWREDLVAFLIGCSFTFESLLTAHGIPLRHNEQARNVPMYRTDRECRPAGRVRGPLVVSMRPVPESMVDTVGALCRQLPAVHGAPVHVGDPAGLGIPDLDRPDYGESVEAQPGDVPVFWACGVTPQAALVTSRPPFAITHSPGHMLITDIPESEYRL